MINKVILIGNLGKDPDIRNHDNGSTYARLTVATDENYKDKNGEWQTITEWHNVVAWRSLAKIAEQRLQKGTRVYVEGKLTSRSWQTKDGETRYITEVRANVIRALARGKSTSEDIPMQDKYDMSGKDSPGPSIGGKAEEEDDLPF